MRTPRQLLRSASLIMALLLVTSASAGETWNGFRGLVDHFLHKEVDVISVTDMTDAGRAYRIPTPAQPVRYKLVYVGQINFGRGWAGETLPTKQKTIEWIMAALKNQGYVVADELHPPEQLFVFGWGMLAGGQSRPGLKFLGGEKVDLMWEQEGFNGETFNPLLTGARVFTRNLKRMGVAGKVWDFSESPLFMGVVRSFSIEAVDEKKGLVQLWETRFGCPATGLAFNETMPLLIAAAAPSFGRETLKPVSINASDIYDSGVNLRELEILGEAEGGPTKAGENLAPESGKGDEK